MNTKKVDCLISRKRIRRERTSWSSSTRTQSSRTWGSLRNHPGKMILRNRYLQLVRGSASAIAAHQWSMSPKTPWYLTRTPPTLSSLPREDKCRRRRTPTPIAYSRATTSRRATREWTARRTSRSWNTARTLRSAYKRCHLSTMINLWRSRSLWARITSQGCQTLVSPSCPISTS